MSAAISWPAVITTPPAVPFDLPPMQGVFDGYTLVLSMASAGKAWRVSDHRYRTSPWSPLLEARLTVNRWGAQIRLNGTVVELSVVGAQGPGRI